MRKRIVISLMVLAVLLGAVTLFKLASRRGRVVSDEEALTTHRKIKERLGLEQEEPKLSIKEKLDDCIFGHIINVMDGVVHTRFDARSGEVLGFSNDRFRQVFYKEQEKLPEIIEATKTKEDVLELSKEYVELITGVPIPQDCYLAKLKYYNSGNGKGEWYILYTRRLNGYEYYTNTGGIGISIVDASGKLISLVRWPESGPCPTEVKISEEEAKEIALREVLKFIEFTEKIAEKEGEDIQDDEIPNPSISSCKLWIVNPNDFLKKFFRGKGVSSSATREVRLAYVIEVDMSTEELFQLIIFVDAATGKIIGGDMKG